LLNQAHTQHQTVAFFFAQENPVHSLQRTSDHFDLHAFMQVRMRVVGQHTGHQGFDRRNLLVWYGLRAMVASHNIDHTELFMMVHREVA
jgi:hypothetical protein